MLENKAGSSDRPAVTLYSVYVITEVSCESPLGLRANAYTVYARPHRAVIPGPTFDIERTGLARRTIRIKRITVGLLIVAVARESASRTHAQNLTGRLDAVAAGRTIGVKKARRRWGIRKEKHNRCKRG